METTSTQPKTFIDVTYFPGRTIYGSLSARLEIVNEQLKLTTVEGTAEQPVYTELFNVPFNELEKVVVFADAIYVTVKQKKYRMSVAQHSTPAIAAGGVAGAGIAYGMYKKSGADDWISYLQSKGVPVKRIGYGKMFGLAAIIAVAMLAIAAFVYFLIEG